MNTGFKLRFNFQIMKNARISVFRKQYVFFYTFLTLLQDRVLLTLVLKLKQI